MLEFALVRETVRPTVSRLFLPVCKIQNRKRPVHECMVDEGPGGSGEELVGVNAARRRRPAHAGRRRRAVHDANIGPCGRGVVPGGCKKLKLRMVDEGPGGGGEELVGANVARRRRPAHAGRGEPQRRRAVHDANIGPCLSLDFIPFKVLKLKRVLS